MIRWKSAPICDDCWAHTQPEREPVRFKTEYRKDEICVACDVETHSGIYVRIRIEIPGYEGVH